MTRATSDPYLYARLCLLEEALVQLTAFVPPEAAIAFAYRYQKELQNIEKLFPANEKPLIITEAN